VRENSSVSIGKGEVSRVLESVGLGQVLERMSKSELGRVRVVVIRCSINHGFMGYVVEVDLYLLQHDTNFYLQIEDWLPVLNLLGQE